MSKKCPWCGNTELINDSNVEFIYCTKCEWYASVEEFAEQTLFDRITVNEETLAEKLVHFESPVWREAYWTSTVIEYSEFASYEEAIAATVAKLKEVANG